MTQNYKDKPETALMADGKVTLAEVLTLEVPPNDLIEAVAQHYMKKHGIETLQAPFSRYQCLPDGEIKVFIRLQPTTEEGQEKA